MPVPFLTIVLLPGVDTELSIFCTWRRCGCNWLCYFATFLVGLSVGWRFNFKLGEPVWPGETGTVFESAKDCLDWDFSAAGEDCKPFSLRLNGEVPFYGLNVGEPWSCKSIETLFAPFLPTSSTNCFLEPSLTVSAFKEFSAKLSRARYWIRLSSWDGSSFLFLLFDYFCSVSSWV